MTRYGTQTIAIANSRINIPTSPTKPPNHFQCSGFSPFPNMAIVDSQPNNKMNPPTMQRFSNSITNDENAREPFPVLIWGRETGRCGAVEALSVPGEFGPTQIGSFLFDPLSNESESDCVFSSFITIHPSSSIEAS